MAKHEYEVYITHVEKRAVFVEAEDYEEAKQIALGKYYEGETEYKEEYTDAEVNWSDEED